MNENRDRQLSERQKLVNEILNNGGWDGIAQVTVLEAGEGAATAVITFVDEFPPMMQKSYTEQISEALRGIVSGIRDKYGPR